MKLFKACSLIILLIMLFNFADVYAYTDANTHISNTDYSIFYYNDFNSSSTIGMSLYTNGSSISVSNGSQHAPALEFVRADGTTSAFYGEITYNKNKIFHPYLTYKMFAQPGQKSTVNLISVRDASTDSVNGSFTFVKAKNGVLYADNEKIYTLLPDERVKLECCVDFYNKEYDVYINDRLCVQNKVISKKLLGIPVSMRIFVPASCDADVLIDDVCIYEGDMPRDITEDDIESIYGGVKDSVVYEDISVKKMLDGVSTFNTRTHIAYVNGKKYALKPPPYFLKDGLVNVEQICRIMQADFKREASKITINDNCVYDAISKTLSVDGALSESENDIYMYDGDIYAPADVLLETVLGKFVQCFGDFASPELIVFSDSNKDFLQYDEESIKKFSRYFRPDSRTLTNDFENAGHNAQHPYVFATREDIELINEKAKNDAFVAQLREKVISDAETKPGFMNLSVAYQLTKNEKYAKKAVELVKKTYSYDWTTLQFIDLSQNAMQMAFVYDLTYEALSDEERKYFEEELKKKVIDETICWYKASKGNSSRFIKAVHNWNEVCNSGTGLCAMAIMNVYPEECSYLIKNICLSLEYYFDYAFFESGASFEGPEYYRYGKFFLWPFVRAMKNSFGTDYNLIEIPGFFNSLGYIMDMHNDNGILFNYSDSGERTTLEADYLYYCHKSGQDNLAKYFMQKLFDKEKATAQSLLCAMIYADSSMISEEYELSPAKLYHENSIDVGVMRGNDSLYTTYAAFKTLGGYPYKSHEQLDHGTFVFDTLGERWVCDLGKEDYDALNGTGYDIWDQEDDRFRVFRNNANSHNTVMINYDSEKYISQSIAGETKVTRFENGKNSAVGVIDMTGALKDDAYDAKRGFYLTDKRRSLVVRDEINLKKDASVTWQIMTGADRAVIEKDKIYLFKNGKIMEVTYSCDKDVTAVFENADFGISLFPNETPNTGINRLSLTFWGNGQESITVKFTPYGLENSDDVKFYDKYIDEWYLDELVVTGICPEISGNKIFADIDAYNGYSDKKDVMIIIAEYSDDFKTLKKSQVKKFTVSSLEEKECDVVFSEFEKAENVRIYAWDMNMKPLCEAVICG